MTTDGRLAPGATERQIRDHYAGPRRLRCIGCGLDFPAEQLDEDELCAECRRDKANEDDPGEDR